MVSTLLPQDTDHFVAEGCGIEARCAEHNLPLAHNTARIIDWKVSPAAGRFGRWDGQTFDPNVADSQVNCWESLAHQASETANDSTPAALDLASRSGG